MKGKGGISKIEINSNDIKTSLRCWFMQLADSLSFNFLISLSQKGCEDIQLVLRASEALQINGLKWICYVFEEA